MACISKDQAKRANDRITKKVLVPEWGDGDDNAYVVVRSMTVAERKEYEKYWDDKYPERNKENGERPPGMDVVARMIIYTVTDDDGNPLFSVDDIPSFDSKNNSIMTRLFNAALELNGVDAQKVREAKAN